MMTEIDKLEGVELAADVAVARGLIFMEGWALVCARWLLPDNSCIDAEDYRPDLNIAQAWELIEEARTIGACIVIGAFPPCYDVELYMSFSDFYAHNTHCVESAHTVGEVCMLICRAYLKAKAAA